ncbi:sugar transferase [bacterium]|jgi:exopolysaccharide biosynthesis polyprenyl glycosylphosphotransferase|nr:sugar transferase [bacterium]MBT6831947.1 sugar transferase [bacterium]MBT6996643.1 sugar transferase [bacterium]MBT7773063.1 sugar transferase [bacterium]
MRKVDIFFALGRILSDGVMIFFALMGAYLFRMHWFGFFGLSAPTTLVPFELFQMYALKLTSALLGIFALNGRYNFDADEKIWDELRSIFWTLTTGLAIIIVLFFFRQSQFFSRWIFGAAWGFSIVLVFCGRLIVRHFRRTWWKNGFGRIRVLLLGTGKLSEEIQKFFEKSPRYALLEIVPEKKFGQLGKFLKSWHPSLVLLATDEPSQQRTGALARLAHSHHADFHFLPDEAALDLAAVEISTLKNHPVLKLKSTRIGGWGAVIKSGIDRTTAAAGLTIFSPIFAAIAWKIWKQDRGPIFYGSTRIGKNGKMFRCWKFRSMVMNADAQKKKLMKKNERKGGVLFKMENDPRVTEFGNFLRKTSLDELPQLWNILCGEMSLIGPRPHLPEEVKKYDADHHPLLSIKPGLTGYAQINGRSSLSFDDEMKYELFYLKNWSPWLDLIIFLKTIFLVLQRKNSA